ncbi:MAG: beta-galactosidase [Lewinellaceae bacterium]|nr:beta-galactosidase [Lewinellaceae bacterium]
MPSKKIPPSFNLSALILVVFLVCKCGSASTPPQLSGEVKPYKGKPTIHLNGKPEAPILYALSDVPGGRWSWEEVPQHNISAFCAQGIRLYQLDIFLEQLWPEDGSFSVETAQKQVRGVLEVCPEAGIFFRFHLNAPKWWTDKYPEENVAYDKVEPSPDEHIGLSRILEADPRNPVRASMASEKWRQAAAEKLRLFCEQFSQTPEGNALAGIHIAYGVYGEWHQWGIINYEADFSPPMTDHFRQWLKAKYTSAEALQEAWSSPDITFDAVSVPDTEERAVITEGIFRHPLKGRRVIDYYECQHELVAGNIIHFCKVVKENWPRPAITGAFYGYFFSMFHRQAAAGHLALQKVLQSEYIDYLSGPQAYYPENGYHAGEPYRSRGLIHSVLLNGKLWLDEYDQQPRRSWPWLGDKDNREVYEKTLEENVSMIRRNMMFPILKGQGLWLYDFGPAGMNLNPENDNNIQAGSSGYWDNPVYMENIGRVKALAGQFLHEEFASAADVLAVYDTESILYLPGTVDNKCPVTHQMINWPTLALYYSGALFDPIHIDDLGKVDISRYKAVVFFNVFVMNEKDRELIQTKIAGGNRHLIWMYAPGYIGGNGISLSSVSDVTGINLDTLSFYERPCLRIDPDFAGAPEQKAWGDYAPLFFIRDDKAVVLGQYAGLGKPGFGYKKFPEHSSWYMGVPVSDPLVFRKIFERAGVQFYAPLKDVVYGGGNLLMIHSVKEGVKEWEKNGRRFEMKFDEAPATKVIDLRSGKVILE